ncbi:purine-nucleoside phosphorylase [Mesohalobacter halotolerans]|uniref:Uridine phosphorylase n=1 Tax=Mesohalobacter halotolerans TaxID=1883405 RepID=A0A4U5TP45_9FLAO|nr:purine-nucleoside phosphorylase [Mesohalobacter halotolerans]MBS3738159.1 purine-nucleoside phosphorylase [Psychroflexus sp.]TKS55622.1 purine-nucleoside phosphorylase [Mesohalobacter halotolerans]
MSIHISAKKGEIADKILLPGDPLRAKWIAETFLDNAFCYNEVRNMFGYTGEYKGQRVSVQGTGMGIPSASIYIEELINDYEVKSLIRVGSAGSLQKNVTLRDIVIAMSASTNSSFNRLKFNGSDYAPTANFELFKKAIDIAKTHNIKYHAGNVFSSDIFYADQKGYYDIWAKYNVLCVEMEVAALYTIAAKFGLQALGILTISDSLINGAHTSAEDREKSFKEMALIGLDTLINE